MPFINAENSDLDNKKIYVLSIAPISPPVNGQARANEKLIKIFREHGFRTIIANTASAPNRSKRQFFLRLLRLVLALLMVPVARLRGAKVVYISTLANSGIFHTALCAFLARGFGFFLILKHHTASYAKTRTTGMAVLSALSGTQAVHITFCQSMSRDLSRHYTFAKRDFILTNAYVMKRTEGINNTIRKEVKCLGHLSNNTFDKGLKRVVDTFRNLSSKIVDLKLIIAGPAESEREREFIREVQKEFGDSFLFLGFVDAEKKQHFFETIDVFLFPSLHPYEASPQVCFESMSYAVPFIAYDWAYVKSATLEAGTYIDTRRNFAERAAHILEQWATNPAQMSDSSMRARAAFDRLVDQSSEQIDGLIKLMDARRLGGHEFR